MCNWVCPKCKKSDHSGCTSGMSTAMYFEPHFVDGVNVNPDRNTFTCTIRCHNCRAMYRRSSSGGEAREEYLGKFKKEKITRIKVGGGVVNITDGTNALTNK